MWLLALFPFLIRLYRLNQPPGLVFDEEIYVGGFESTRHPPLGSLLFGLSRKILGDNPWGWRLPSVLAGTLLIPLVYFFSQKLWLNRRVALVAALLLSFETLTFVHSRLATIDILLTFFVLASFSLFITGLRSRKGTFSWPLLGAGLFLGLALAIKWSAVFSWVVFLLIVAAGRNWKRVLLFLILPVLVYLVPFFLGGFDVNEVLSWHRQTFFFHTQTKEGFNLELSSGFWSWPLVFSPVSYFRTEIFTPDEHVTQVINVFGNMPLFWAFLPCFGFLAWEVFRSWQEGKPRLMISHLFLMICFFFHWLPWVFFPRPTFGYYFLPVIPFGCMAVAYWLEKAWQRSGLRSLVIGYLALVIGFFILLYPILTALPIPEKVFDFINRF